MDLRKLIFVNNDCYKTGVKMKIKGIMLHSTGAPNPFLSRYVQPDDGHLGKNIYNNHWNMSNAEAIRRFGKTLSKCCHAFIGYLKDKKGIATYQVLPWDHRGWHCFQGPNGSGNDGYISVEICEDNLNDKTYAMAVLQEAKEWAAYLCKIYKLNPLGKDVIIDHARGHAMGIASNHGDILHWYRKWGVTLDSIRKDVKAIMDKDQPTPEPKPPSGKTLYRVQVGAFNVKTNATNYMNKLKKDGYDAFVVQVTKDGKQLYRVQVGAFSVKSNAENYMKQLQKDGYDAFIVQVITATPTIKVGSKVKVKAGAGTYTGGGLQSWVYTTIFSVMELKNNRAVIGLNGTVTAAMNINDLILQ